MGFLIWAVLSLGVLASGWAVVLRHGKALSLAEQFVSAAVIAIAFILAPTLALGFANVLYAGALGGTVAALCVGAIALSRPSRADARALGVRFGAAIRGCVRGPAAAVMTVAALGLVLFLAAYVVLLPSWGWDAMNYHGTTTAYAYQTHSLGWYAVAPRVALQLCNSYPKNVELLSLWNGIFAPDDRLIDGAQLPLVLMAVVALAGMARRAGLAARHAWPLGLCWLFMPAVFLNTPTGYVDAGAASLGIAAVFLLARARLGTFEALVGALALGEAVGAKVSGALLAVLLIPVVLVGTWRALGAHDRASVLRGIARISAMAALVVGLGGYSYLRDLVRFGNPVWPVRAKIPLLGGTFPGIWDMRLLNTPPFGGPDSLQAMFRSFADWHPTYMVDVRTGGFGPVWLCVLLPVFVGAMLWAILRAIRRVPTPAALMAAVLGLWALATPAHWWPRYTLGFPAAGLVAVAIALAGLQRWLRVKTALTELALSALALAVLAQAWPARTGFFAPRDHDAKPWLRLEQAWHLDPAQRNAMHFDNWQQPGIALRDQVVEPGEASAYDGSTSFVYQLWRSDWKNRVLYLPLENDGDPQAWLAKLDAEKVRWASFGRGSLAERTLRAAGWRFLWPCGAEGCDVWARPGTAIPAGAR